MVLLLLGSSVLAQAQQQTVDEIVAVVGDQIILMSEVDAMVANSLRQQPQTPYNDLMWMQTLDQMINQNVMSVVARRDTNIVVTDEQVNKALDQRIQQMIAQLGSQARLEEVYGKSLVRIKAELQDDFRNQLLAEQLQQTKMRDIRITPTEVKQWFDQFPTDSLPTMPPIVRVAHIVRYPAVTDVAKADARQIISSIRDSVVTGGADFDDMARRFSEDPGSATAGGRIEDINQSDLVPEFSAVASRIPVGEISQIFESPFGYHILRVNERRGEILDFNHILIRIDDSQIDPTETIAYLSTLRDSILNQNTPFALMAKTHSQEEASANLGGRVIDPRSGERDLVAESLGPLWRATIDTLELGEVSKPARVELQNERQAFHIVELQRRTGEHQVDLATDYERIEQYALQEKRARVMQTWLDQLRDQVYVDLRGKAAQFAPADQAALRL
jgi:peptidyl-prolyl cis-trans isomerase SurA